ncbi:MAG: sugar transferase [Rubripirellula sp.]
MPIVVKLGPRVYPIAELSSYLKYKPIIDRLLTLVMMIVAAPLMVLVAVFILIADGRPIFFHQTRVGKDGRLFRIRKFRTMQPDAERCTGAVWSTESDVRVTRLGRWLRCSHLDELPQLFNVLSGEMNLVGPRPERPEFVETLSQEVPGYLERIRVRPGITGLAQLRLGYDQDLSGIPQKVAHDLDYIQGATFAKDLGFLEMTIPHVARELHARWIKKRTGDQVGDEATAKQQSRSIESYGIHANGEHEKVTHPLRIQSRVRVFSDSEVA